MKHRGKIGPDAQPSQVSRAHYGPHDPEPIMSLLYRSRIEGKPNAIMLHISLQRFSHLDDCLRKYGLRITILIINVIKRMQTSL